MQYTCVSSIGGAMELRAVEVRFGTPTCLLEHTIWLEAYSFYLLHVI